MNKVNIVYKTKLRQKRFSIRVQDKDVPISPGMAVTAETKTGQKRVIEFFLSPLIKHVVIPVVGNGKDDLGIQMTSKGGDRC